MKGRLDGGGKGRDPPRFYLIWALLRDRMTAMENTMPLRTSLRKEMEGILSPKESAKFIAENSKDVSIEDDGIRRIAEMLFDKVLEKQFSITSWKSSHELNPQAVTEDAVNWVFLVDALNFSFWSEHEDHKCLVKYKGKPYSGYWSLCAAVNRALDEGGVERALKRRRWGHFGGQGRKVAFYKRAQILVADTWSVLEGKGDGCFSDISSVTIFADYRIPQVLVYLGAMKYSDELMKKLKEGHMFQSGDKQEVEIRGCSIWCCDLICNCLLDLYKKKGEDMSGKINAVFLDYYLWDYARDHREEMKGIPFHHVRCIYY
ncbi:queuosine salvage protein isoform X3 [Varanus komodoensis]|uniref:queuosine salvage protein isoform X3 n=1 Tax=Varanus komodoensis TaxID=61221 RepID=UPI001CF77501|nr:queuosine salvage protein isoform X3 [Varanus komodoensis]